MVGAGNAMGAAISDNAIIVKMIRVMMLVPVLIVIAFFAARNAANGEHIEGEKKENTSALVRYNVLISYLFQ